MRRKAIGLTPHSIVQLVLLLPVSRRFLHFAVERPVDDIKLLLASQLDEVHRITRYADRQLWILLWMIHCV
ncbi:hypothetical protein D3C73_1617860 [compost metagenome]